MVGGGRRGRRRRRARRAAGVPPRRRQQRRLRQRHLRHVVPGRRVHGRRQPRSDRAHQPVRPDDRRLARVRHPRRARGRRARTAASTVPARSTRVIDLGAPGAGAQGEPVLAVTVDVDAWAAGGRPLAALPRRRPARGPRSRWRQPAPRDQWWFANGRKGAGITERYSIYNPTDDDVEVDADLRRHTRRRSKPSRSPFPRTRS